MPLESWRIYKKICSYL